MKFENMNDIHTRYVGTFIGYKKKVCRVETVGGSARDPKFLLRPRHGEMFEIHPYTEDAQDTILDKRKSFYVRSELGKLCYITRNPTRQWRQGFLPKQYSVQILDPESNVQSRSRNTQRFGIQREPFGSNFDLAKAALYPEITSVQNIQDKLNQGDFAILATDLVVSAQGHVFYKDAPVGQYRDGVVNLLRESKWVSDHLGRLGIQCVVQNRSRKWLKARISPLDMEQAGVPEDIIEQLVQAQQPERQLEQEPRPVRAQRRQGFEAFLDARREIGM